MIKSHLFHFAMFGQIFQSIEGHKWSLSNCESPQFDTPVVPLYFVQFALISLLSFHVCG